MLIVTIGMQLETAHEFNLSGRSNGHDWTVFAKPRIRRIAQRCVLCILPHFDLQTLTLSPPPPKLARAAEMLRDVLLDLKRVPGRITTLFLPPLG